MKKDNQPNPSNSLTIAIVGDVHDAWDAQDERALRRLGADLVLLVGDFGNESVPVVRAIASMKLPKAVILGNHDAWYTATEWGRSKCPYDRTQEDWVQQQLDLLGETHVGYGKLDFPEFGLSVVGGRPFSWGGSEWKYAQFYRDRYGVEDMAQSTERIVKAAAATAYDTVLFIGHCGPTGLGNQPEDPCGRDWKPLGGDFGDPDLQMAIGQTRNLGKTIPLVAFGHMHHQLRHRRDRLRRPTHVDEAGTVYVNAANVPRIIRTDEDCFRNVSLVTLRDGEVTQAALVWLSEDLNIKSKQIFYQKPFPEPELVTQPGSDALQ
ncbi:TIGR04168 family protein [Leptolyngbya sp. AN02str]|uniref:TIGR04168 family protein n=1 Tax=Leptolyngbya sp. AN02str TaxID=3423363 RepID=UPI003D3179B4